MPAWARKHSVHCGSTSSIVVFLTISATHRAGIRQTDIESIHHGHEDHHSYLADLEDAAGVEVRCCTDLDKLFVEKLL